jgi:hypothetical protein
VVEEEREARGVHNPKVVDLIRFDPERGEVVLLMLEQRPWGSTPEQLRQLEAKFNGYLSYALDGFLAAQFPQYSGRPVCIRLDCVMPPGDEERAMLSSMQGFATSVEIRFEVNVIQGGAFEP